MDRVAPVATRFIVVAPSLTPDSYNLTLQESPPSLGLEGVSSFYFHVARIVWAAHERFSGKTSSLTAVSICHNQTYMKGGRHA